MAKHALTLQLPDPLFQYLSDIARATSQPLERVAAQSIAGNLPPSIVSAPPELQAELAALQGLPVPELLAAAAAQVPAGKVSRHQELLEHNREGCLTEAERSELVRLRREADVVMLRKAYAASVLKWLGEPSLYPEVPSE
ncbi:MAG: hypothetical protein HY721_23740 [Planctomycetes bacterium]|nr:hypothetical protein [Planctomycetota bacterium]